MDRFKDRFAKTINGQASFFFIKNTLLKKFKYAKVICVGMCCSDGVSKPIIIRHYDVKASTNMVGGMGISEYRAQFNDSCFEPPTA